MKIEAVDFFYASMPEVTLDADGSQDALLVRISAGGHFGWGECEASPLVSIVAFVAPRSHGACQPVSASVLGETLATVDDIYRIGALVRRNSMDMLQATHTFSGIEMAMWDLLGKANDQPAWELLGYRESFAKTPYASLLFGGTPQETLDRAKAVRARGFRAVKFGWGPFGLGTLREDIEQVQAAREGTGDDGRLLVDAGQIWEGNFDGAATRLPALNDARVEWLEEPFGGDSFADNSKLAAQSGKVAIAGGEASHNRRMAENLILFGGVRYIQIDSGRIGGLGPSKQVADFASAKGIPYVNHTFTSHLALSASLQPFAGLRESSLCEFPMDPKAVASAIVENPLSMDEDGLVRAPEAPGLGVTIDLGAISPYLRSVTVTVDGETVYDDAARP